ncbi:DUF2279 domain-containing protein [Cesiribacter sp. SM1]|uniref:DUF2279 domain-containing protein n=1 Tax=Cesiribacter sp. SM1 TaxID=2861196 RepID=UPI001CD76CC0|nr:DUF2279 domain-containing protein [Cesiribacter sp. SM1]
MKNFLLCFFLLTTLLHQEAPAQAIPDTLQPRRMRTVLLVSGTAYTGLVLGLNELWYKGHERESFHFFNDNREWQQVDKAGHAYSTYHLSRIHYQTLRWAGMPARKAALWSSIGGLAWMLPVEILDGFSAAYGASAGDLVANTSGALLFGSQQLLWGQQFVNLKFSFHPSTWAPKRPRLLGKSFPEQLMKDYNGQTYWLSADIAAMSRGKWPSWLNIALGYGASGMVYADPAQNQAAGYMDYRQLFIAPDINLSRIRTNKKALRVLLFVLEGIHLPTPAIELSRKKLYFHPIYF